MAIWLKRDESKTQKYWCITYESSSFFLNLFTGRTASAREREKKVKTMAYLKMANLIAIWLINKERKVVGSFLNCLILSENLFFFSCMQLLPSYTLCVFSLISEVNQRDTVLSEKEVFVNNFWNNQKTKVHSKRFTLVKLFLVPILSS